MYQILYQNRLGFVEDMTQTFWCVFSVHSVVDAVALLTVCERSVNRRAVTLALYMV